MDVNGDKLNNFIVVFRKNQRCKLIISRIV